MRNIKDTTRNQGGLSFSGGTSKGTVTSGVGGSFSSSLTAAKKKKAVARQRLGPEAIKRFMERQRASLLPTTSGGTLAGQLPGKLR